MESGNILKHMAEPLPYEKIESGTNVNELTDPELLAVIIGTGTRGFNVLDLSTNLIRKYGSLRAILNSGINDISKEKGMGIKKTIRLKAAFEIGKRSIVEKPETNILDSPLAVWKFLLPETANLETEEFRVLSLNNKNRLIGKNFVSKGTVNETLVHPREVFRNAVREGAAGIIVAHNHPSGNTSPSRQDIETTRRLCEAGKLMGIPLIDHIIISNTSYMSMKEGGYM